MSFSFVYQRRQQGVGLIEVLIAVLVLGVGVLGVMALQGTTLKNNQSSLARTQAVILSYAMLDALRINREEALAESYNMDKTCEAPSGNTLVKRDQNYWITSLKSGLGDAETTCGEINCDAAGVCTITVYWDDSRGTGGSDAQTIATSTRI